MAAAPARTIAIPQSWTVPLNIGAVLLLLAILSLWIYCYVGSMPIFLATLAAILYNLVHPFFKFLREGRLKSFMRAFDRHVIQYRWTWAIVLSSLPVLFLFAAKLGSIEVTSTDGNERWVELSREIEGGREKIVKAGYATKGGTKFLLWTGFFSPRDYWIQPKDLQSVPKELKPFRVLRLHIPKDFQRPAVLIAPLEWLRNTVNNYDYDLRVTITRREGTSPYPETLEGYKGWLVWIGAPSDFPLPKGFEAQTTTPRSVQPNLFLEQDDRVLIEVLPQGCEPTPEGCAPYRREVTLEEPRVQVVELGDES